MKLESLLNPPEPSQRPGTKRLRGLSDVGGRGGEAKRSCTQFIELSWGSAALGLNSGQDSWGGLQFDDAGSQCDLDLRTEWQNGGSPLVFDGLDSTSNSLAAGSDPSLFNSVLTQNRELSLHNSSGVDRFYQQPEVQGSGNSFDSSYSPHVNETLARSFQLRHNPYISYNGNWVGSGMNPDVTYWSSTDTSADYTSTWIDSTIDPKTNSEYQPLELFASHGSQSIERASNDDGTFITNLEEAKWVNYEDTSTNFSTLVGQGTDLVGKLRNYHVFFSRI